MGALIIIIFFVIVIAIIKGNLKSKPEEKRDYKKDNSISQREYIPSENKSTMGSFEKKYEDLEKEKKLAFEKYYAEFKDFKISTLEFLIESGKKSSYEDYTEDDKIKFKAQKTLIEEKRKDEELLRIQNQLQSVKINQNLVESINKNYNTVNEIDKIVRSINFKFLNYSEKSKIINFLELKNSMSTKQFYETVFRGYHCDDIEEISFNYKCLPDGSFEIYRKYKENGSEYNSTWTGNIISKQDIDLNNAYKKEKDELDAAVKIYSKIIESESTPIATYINTAERISIILGKQKSHEIDYYFLSNIYNVIRESSKNNDFGFFNPTIISKRLEKAENKIKK